MALEFRLPDLGEGMVEAELVRWLVKPGDRVALDQAIAEVQTDKAVVEIPSPAAGTVLSLDVEEGQTVPVETLLLTIEDGAQDGVPSLVPTAPDAPDTASPERVATAPTGAATAAPASPAAPAAPPSTTTPSTSNATAGPGRAGANGGSSGGGGGRWTEAAVSPRRRALATPAVRRMARELGLDIAALRGSGPAGRVLAEDLRAASIAPPPTDDQAPTAGARAGRASAADGPSAGAPAPEFPPLAARATMPGDVDEGPAEERLPLRGLRKRIAENMVRAASTIPMVSSLDEIDASGLVALRRSVLPAAQERGIKLSYLPFIVKALVQTLRAYPYLNAAIDEASSEIVLKRHYHVGIATATPDGLLVPVLRHADRLTILEIASELTRLAELGRERKLKADELRGSTFTITNYGAMGGYLATPIINPGEAAILGLGRIAERPWVVDGRVEARPILPLSLTSDHRLIDGELAIRFLNTLSATLRNPNLLFLEMR